MSTPATDEAPALRKDVVPTKYREAYKATGGTNGDFLAQLLQTVAKDGIPAVQAVMKENGIPEKKWATLNVGQQRMNLANVLRSRFLKGDDITVLGKQHNIRHMADDYNGAQLDKSKPATIVKFAETINVKTDDRTLGIITKTFFPPEKAPKKSAEAKAAEKAERDAHKNEAKAQKKAKADLDKAVAASAKAVTARDAAQAKVDEADAAHKAVPADDKAGKAKAKKALDGAKEKLKAATSKANDAQKAADKARKAVPADPPAVEA